jgi:hypothetical protein
LRPERKAKESGRSAEEDIDLVAKSIKLAWSSKRADDRLIHSLEAVAYAIQGNTAKLEGIRRVLLSYD